MYISFHDVKAQKFIVKVKNVKCKVHPKAGNEDPSGGGER
jgi:hypothetical protein